MPAIRPVYSSEEAILAHKAWGANCGPNALAVALGIHVDATRPLLPAFDGRRFTNPSMMQHALELAGRRYVARRVTESMFREGVSLVRIQWHGPWTAPGANPRWAYRQTHWITTWTEQGQPVVFDVNIGVVHQVTWESETVPSITSGIPRADGKWSATHVWELVPVTPKEVTA